MLHQIQFFILVNIVDPEIYIVHQKFIVREPGKIEISCVEQDGWYEGVAKIVKVTANESAQT